MKRNGIHGLLSLLLSAVFFMSSPCDAQEGNPASVSSRESLQERREQVKRRLESIRQSQPPETVAPAVQKQEEEWIEEDDGRRQKVVQDQILNVQKGNASSPNERPKRVTMNFKNVELQSLVKLMSDLTGKNFIVDPNLKGQMTIISQNEISVDEAYRVFLSVLEVHGFTVMESGNVAKVIQAVDAKTKGIETLGLKSFRAEDRMATRLIPLKHGDTADFAKFLAPLVAKTGLMVPYPDTNTLIVIDTMSNIERVLKIVNELDIPGSKEQIVIFRLESANAEKLATKLTSLFQRKDAAGQRGSREHIKIVADERSNSLIAMASPQLMNDLTNMLEQLDQKHLRKRGVHIYPLQHAVAEDVAKVLGQLSGKTAETKDPKGAAQPPVLSKEVQISPDKATNSLVIIAEPDEYQTILDIVQELDRPRTMVYVEALIVEVSASKSLDLGVEWRGADTFNGGFRAGSSGGVVIGGSPGGSAVDALARGVLPSGFSVGVVGRAISLGNVVFPSFGAFVRAVRSDTDFNVLSTPQILTLDNAEALIEVGQNIPFVTRVDQPSQVTERAIQTFEYRDVGVTLKVTPQINNNRTVRLGIEQSVKSVLERTALGGSVLAPTTTFRRAKTAITVKDGETAVIGGLIENRLDRGRTETPCLGGVPALGWLFKNTTDRDEKTNLLVFLSPRIVENPDENRQLYLDKKSRADSEMDRARNDNHIEPIRRKAIE
jgi:general secretion pathway protein D